MTTETDDRPNGWLGGLLVLLTRGFLLWLEVPVAVLAWVFVGPLLRRRDVRFGQFLGWLDLNVAVALQRGPFRPLVRRPAAFVPVREMPSVTHRVRFTDPA